MRRGQLDSRTRGVFEPGQRRATPDHGEFLLPPSPCLLANVAGHRIGVTKTESSGVRVGRGGRGGGEGEWLAWGGGELSDAGSPSFPLTTLSTISSAGTRSLFRLNRHTTSTPYVSFNDFWGILAACLPHQMRQSHRTGARAPA